MTHQRDVTSERGGELVQQRTTTTTYHEKIEKVEAGVATLTLTYARVQHVQSSTLFPTTLRFDSKQPEDVQRAHKDVSLRTFAVLVSHTP